MRFTPVNEIERLLIAATQDASARPQFYRALTEHDLLIISETPQPPADPASAPKGAMSVQIQMIEVQERPHVPIFTSKERVAAFVKAESPYLAMNGRALFTMLRGAEAVMNPGSEFGKLFIKAEIEAILDGSILRLGPTQNLGGQQVMLSQPAEYPRHLTEALVALFPKHPRVKSAYLARAVFTGPDPTPHTMIGIEIEGDWKVVASEAGLVAQSVAKPGEIIDFMQMSDKREEGVSNYLRATTPFYRGA